MSKLTFYTNPMSRGRIIRWALEEFGEPYDTEILDFATSMKAPDYLAINPMGKVPAIKHGEQVVTECAAICAYLADVFPQAKLAPREDEKAAYYRWLFYFSGPLEAAILNRSLGFEVDSEQERTAGYGSFDKVMSAVDELLGGQDYVAGSRFTAADIYCGSQIGWGIEFGTIEATANFEKYWARLSDRPARVRAAEIDDALLIDAQ